MTIANRMLSLPLTKAKVAITCSGGRSNYQVRYKSGLAKSYLIPQNAFGMEALKHIEEGEFLFQMIFMVMCVVQQQTVTSSNASNSVSSDTGIDEGNSSTKSLFNNQGIIMKQCNGL